MTNRSKGDISRHRILTASLDLFSEQGFARTSVQEIADRCNISQTTVFYHFKNKKKLFESLLSQVILNNREYFALNLREADGLTEFEKLVFLLESNINWAMKYPKDAQVLIMLFNFATSDSDFKKLATGTIDNGRALVFDALVLINKERQVSQAFSLVELSVIIQQYVNGVIFQILAREDRSEVHNNFKKTIKNYLNILIYK